MKRILPYFLIISVLAGLLSPMAEMQAQGATNKWYTEYYTINNLLGGYQSDNKIGGPFDTKEICESQPVGRSAMRKSQAFR